LALAPLITPTVFRLAPLCWGNGAYGNIDLIQAVSSMRLGKLAKGVFFVNPSFGDKFKFNASSST